ncbi:MAG: ABC transporter ATP-binding protein [Candidatus Sericytochromatia bacterium]
MKKLFTLLKLSTFFRQLPYISRTIKLIKEASGKISLIWFITLIIQGFLPLLFIYLLKPLIDNISKNNLVLDDIFYKILILLGIFFITEILKSFTNYLRNLQGELVRDYTQSLIHKKSLSLDLSFFDSSEFYDKLFRASTETLTRPIALLENIGNLIQNSITLFSILALLFFFKWWFPLVLILGTIPTIPLLLFQTVKFHEWRKKITLEQRKIRYYDYLLTQRESAAELRLFNIGNYFSNLFINTSLKIRNEQKKLSFNQLITDIFIILWYLLILSFIIIFIVKETVNGLISLGSLVMIYVALDRSQKTINILVNNLTETYKNMMFLENLFEFLDIKNNTLGLKDKVFNKSKNDFKIEKSIKINNISFSYNFNQDKSLDNLNMEIEANKITAIVGTNGAGKSTLIKMLCRFYDPQEGNIEVDGIDYKKFSQEDIYKNTVVLFQDYLKFNLSLLENIGLGNYEDKMPEFSKIEEATINSGAKNIVDKLPDSYKSILGKWFYGSELSTGEWQKIALARAFIKPADFIIFDEPTSAMDSWAEAEWIKKFKERVKGHTSLIITHRFTTAMQADMIYVMDKGMVIEKGTHEELMNLNKTYASSWKEQLRNVV